MTDAEIAARRAERLRRIRNGSWTDPEELVARPEVTVIHIITGSDKPKFIARVTAPFPVLLENLTDHILYAVVRRQGGAGLRVFAARGYQLKADWERYDLELSLVRHNKDAFTERTRLKADESLRRQGYMRVLLPNGYETLVQAIPVNWRELGQDEINRRCGWTETI